MPCAFGLIVAGALVITPENSADILFFLLTVSIGVATHIGMECFTESLLVMSPSNLGEKAKTGLITIVTVAAMYFCSTIVTDRFLGHHSEVDHLEHAKELIKIVIVVYLMRRFMKSRDG